MKREAVRIPVRPSAARMSPWDWSRRAERTAPSRRRRMLVHVLLVALADIPPTAALRAQTTITTDTTVSTDTALGYSVVTGGATLTLDGGASTGTTLSIGSDPDYGGVAPLAGGLLLTNGATLTLSYPDYPYGVLSVGVGEASGPAIATITGAGTQLTAWGVAVGMYNSVGSLTISDGGSLVTTGDISRIGGPAIGFWLGRQEGTGSGTITVTGAGSSWVDHAGAVAIGGAPGAGRLVVSDGATATFSGILLLGAGNTGALEIRGAGSAVSASLFTGDTGSATLTVADGGVFAGTIS
nr:hypothetical protein [Opitutaceae bacterium]